MKQRVTTLQTLKTKGQRFAALTCYDYGQALALDQAGIEVCLVGDSLGMVVLGLDSTLAVTVEDMLHHAKAVRRGLKDALLVVDLPFLSYQSGPQEALRNAGRLIKESGAEAVKLEGGAELAPTVRFLRQAGIAVMGHVGLTPQSVHALGGYKVQGRSAAAAKKLIADAKALEAAGAFAVVLELIPSALAKRVTRALRIPTIGIGSGPHCDGQVLVAHDALGLLPGRVPGHAKVYEQLFVSTVQGMRAYAADVRAGRYPTAKHTPA